jgi:aminopeptidase
VSRIERLAELIVTVGANVQPGQIVAVTAESGNEELVRAVAAATYRRGAKFVDPAIHDPYIKRARLLHADPETLGYVPPWYGERMLALGEHRAARISIQGATAPRLFEDIDPELVGRDLLPRLPESMKVVNARTTNWTYAPSPTPEWAQLVHPDLKPEAALERLWDEMTYVCRLDEPDPVAAWNERVDLLAKVAEKLSSLGLESLRFEGPGTDLSIGLLPTSRWWGARFTTVDGLVHLPNIPTEEVFTTPDPTHVDGTVRATKPLLHSGTVIEGLAIRFEAGRAIEIDADSGAGVLRSLTARDPGAARLGEVALVDRLGRIGPLGTVFYNTLLDENAASHIALGQGFTFAVGDEDAERINSSDIHIDFMIGGNDVAVTGMLHDGSEVPLLRDGAWQI